MLKDEEDRLNAVLVLQVLVMCSFSSVPMSLSRLVKDSRKHVDLVEVSCLLSEGIKDQSL